MQQIELLLNGRQVTNRQHHESKVEVLLRVNGDDVYAATAEPKKLTQPEQIGAQVLAYVPRSSDIQTCTKIGPDMWASGHVYRDNYGKHALICSWSDLAVTRIISPGPEPEEDDLEEPPGVGAIIETDDTDCDENGSVFVKASESRWVCQSCGEASSWEELVGPGDLTWSLIREGLVLAKGVEK